MQRPFTCSSLFNPCRFVYSFTCKFFFSSISPTNELFWLCMIRGPSKRGQLLNLCYEICWLYMMRWILLAWELQTGYRNDTEDESTHHVNVGIMMMYGGPNTWLISLTATHDSWHKIACTGSKNNLFCSIPWRLRHQFLYGALIDALSSEVCTCFLIWMCILCGTKIIENWF